MLKTIPDQTKLVCYNSLVVIASKGIKVYNVVFPV